MNSFKEWLSDYLRYFMLALAALLIFALTMIGIRIYQNVKNPQSEDVIVIETETEEATEKVTETESESETESETETQSETESESQSESESESEAESESETESEPLSKAVTESESAAEKKTAPTAETETKVQPVTEKTAEKKTMPVTEKQTESETETETEYVYVPVYKTLQGSCYLRSGPSMEAEIIGEYMYGTTVEFLEDVGGWYKVQIDGMVGYMGARFF